jgi:hypothetical protein
MPQPSYEAAPPEPAASETTTIRGSSGSLLVLPRVGSNRLLFVLGGLTVGLAAVAIMLVVSNDRPASPGTRVSYNDIERPIAPPGSATDTNRAAKPDVPSPKPIANEIPAEAQAPPRPAINDASPTPDIAVPVTALHDDNPKLAPALARQGAAADTAPRDHSSKLTPAGLGEHRPGPAAGVNIPRCDADALAENALQQFHADQLKESLALYQAAYACKSSPTLLQKAFLLACNLRDLAKARSFWKRMTPMLRTQALGSCVRNEITADMLDPP